MKKHRKANRTTLLFLCILFFLSVACGIFFSFSFNKVLTFANKNTLPTPEQEAKKMHATCSKPKNSRAPDKSQCYPQEFYKLTMKTDINFAYDTVFKLQSIDTYAKGCHLIAHGIGWAVYDKDPENWKTAFQEVPKTCNFGAIHGIFERYTRNNKGSFLDKKTLQAICSEKQSACIHIIGHLLVVETGNNLEQSKELCSSFPITNENRSDCLQGVYMEHMIGPNLYTHGLISEERRKNWALHIDEFERLCRKENGEQATACWGIISIAANSYYQKDAQKILEFCSTAQTVEAASYCRRVAVGITSSSWANDLKDYNVCDLPQPNDPTFKKDCLVVFVNTILANISAKDSKKVVDFCSSLSPSEKLICFQTINNSFSRLSVNEQHKNTVCSYVTEDYKAICLGNDDFQGNTKNEPAVFEKEMLE
jgi:hypothetical protein